MTVRYTSNTFPPYAFVPSYYPHPKANPDGHSYGQEEKEFKTIDESTYKNSNDYLFGIDLFNHGYYWEAHEVWEGLWKAHGKEGTTADFIKALIRLSASGVKVRQGQINGIKDHSKFSGDMFIKIKDKTSKNNYLGLSLNSLIKLCSDVYQNAENLRSDPEKYKVEKIFKQDLLLE